MGDMEYKTVPLPAEPRKFKGLKNPVDRASRTMTEILNEESRGGWSFVRAERIELEMRTGLLRRHDEVDVTLLIFSRETTESGRAGSAQRTEPRSVRSPQPASDGMERPIPPSATGHLDAVPRDPERTAD